MMNFLNFRGKVAYNSVGVNELSFCLSWVGEGGEGRGIGICYFMPGVFVFHFSTSSDPAVNHCLSFHKKQGK